MTTPDDSWLEIALPRPKLVLSLGAGVQSSTMAFMYKYRFLEPMPDAAIFSDTQEEPKVVMDWLAYLESEMPFPIYRVTRGNLGKAAIRVKQSRKTGARYIETAIPVFTLDGLKRGRGQRHCTRDYKIAPITAKTRQLLGVRRVSSKSGVLVEMAIGISTDEIDRMKPNPKAWIRNVHPLIDAGYSRADCLNWMSMLGLPEPPRSACVFCPFHSDQQWVWLLAHEPEAFQRAAKFEKQLQAAYAATDRLTSTPYLHASRVPLEQVQFKQHEPMKEVDKFRNECEGMCGV